MGRSVVEGKLVVPSRLEEVGRVEQQLLTAIAEHGYAGSDCFAIKLALEEALANAIKHGNASDPAKQVQVTYQVDPARVRIEVCDEGPGFDPEDVPDPTLDENLEKPFGRGVMLMRTYMTEVSYNASGNCVILVKARSSEQASSKSS
ncbi:MAG: ATP-binding protein [Phycisphaeraceae bacterium]